MWYARGAVGWSVGLVLPSLFFLSSSSLWAAVLTPGHPQMGDKGFWDTWHLLCSSLRDRDLMMLRPLPFRLGTNRSLGVPVQGMGVEPGDF